MDTLSELAAAASPALAWIAIGVPFDVVRTRLQTTSATRFRGAAHCLAHTVRHDGPMALWRGWLPQLLISLPYSTIMFGTYARLKPAPPEAGVDARYFGSVFVAGVGSGVLLTALQNPLDVWRTRLQTFNAGVSGAAAPVAGASALGKGQAFRGLSMTAFRNMPGNGVFFLTNEALRAESKRRPGLREKFSPATLELLIGGLTGVIFNLILTPAEVLRSRMMATTSGGLRHHAKRVLAEHGPLGFFRGAGVSTAKALPVNAAGFALMYWTRERMGLEAGS